MRIIKWIVLSFLSVCFTVSIIAFLSDRIKKENMHLAYGIYEKYIKRPQDFLCALLDFRPHGFCR